MGISPRTNNCVLRVGGWVSSPDITWSFVYCQEWPLSNRPVIPLSFIRWDPETKQNTCSAPFNLPAIHYKSTLPMMDLPTYSYLHRVYLLFLDCLQTPPLPSCLSPFLAPVPLCLWDCLVLRHFSESFRSWQTALSILQCTHQRSPYILVNIYNYSTFWFGMTQ